MLAPRTTGASGPYQSAIRSRVASETRRAPSSHPKWAAS